MSTTSGLIIPTFGKGPLPKGKGKKLHQRIPIPKRPSTLTFGIQGPGTQVPFPRIGLQTPRLRIPRCVPQRPKSIERENPWVHESNSNSMYHNLTAVTPIGTFKRVPTTPKRPPRTPRQIRPTKRSPNPELNPILIADIYLDTSKSDDRDYNFVQNHMRTLSHNTSMMQRQFEHELKPCPKLQGRVSAAEFERALLVYENNQVYYQIQLDDNPDMSDQEIETELSQLEYWFMMIIEPSSYTKDGSWKDRERRKLSDGFSAYCDPDLHEYIQPMSSVTRDLISNHHRRLRL